MGIFKKRGFFKGRKAVVGDVLFILFDLVIVALAINIYFKAAAGTVSGPLVDMNYVATDMALLTESVLTSPGNLFLIYSEDKIADKHDISLGYEIGKDSSNLLVTAAGTTKKARYPFSLDLWLNRAGLGRMSNLKGGILLVKTGNDFGVGNSNQIGRLSYEKMFYFDVDTYSPGWANSNRIIFDAGHYPDDPGYEGKVVEYEKTKQIVDVIHAGIANRNKAVLEQASVPEKVKKIGQADMLISIHMGSYTDGRFNPIKAYIPLYSVESRKLASIISNLLLTSYEFSTASVIPVDVSQLSEDDYRKVLRPDFPSVVLEIGNVNGDMFSTDSQIGGIASTIKKGVENYYSASAAAQLDVEIPRKEPPQIELVENKNQHSDSITINQGG